MDIFRHELLDGRSTSQAIGSAKWDLRVCENNVQHRQRRHRILRENSNREKPRGGGEEIHYNMWSTRITGIFRVRFSVGLLRSRSRKKDPFSLEKKIYLSSVWSTCIKADNTSVIFITARTACVDWFNDRDYWRLSFEIACREICFGL